MSAATALRYLPVQVGDQWFGLPLENVILIQYMQESEFAAPIQPSDPVSPDQPAGLPVISLARLLLDQQEQSPLAVAVRSRLDNCAFMVRSVRPIQTADIERLHPVPVIASPQGGIYLCVVMDEQNQPVLVLDIDGLIARFKQARPDLVMERGVHV